MLGTWTTGFSHLIATDNFRIACCLEQSILMQEYSRFAAGMLISQECSECSARNSPTVASTNESMVAATPEDNSDDRSVLHAE